MRIRACGRAIIIKLVAGAVPVRVGLEISQLYGGGGNSGDTYKNDFIELLNACGVMTDLGGESVQYATLTGISWQVTALCGTL